MLARWILSVVFLQFALEFGFALQVNLSGVDYEPPLFAASRVP